MPFWSAASYHKNCKQLSVLGPPQFKQAHFKETWTGSEWLEEFSTVPNLPFIPQILEKVVLTQLQKHLSENDLLEIKQCAYKKSKKKSTETALLSVVGGLLRNADDRLVSVLALLDLCAAFDTLDDPILLQRLETTFGISGTVLDWFASYVEGREQSVMVDNVLERSQPPSVRGSAGFGPWANPVHIVLSAPPWLDMSPWVWLSQICWWYPVVKVGSSRLISVSSLWYPDLHWKSCRLDVQQQAQTKCRKDRSSSFAYTSRLSSG